jgi:hypothetical protein
MSHKFHREEIKQYTTIETCVNYSFPPNDIFRFQVSVQADPTRSVSDIRNNQAGDHSRLNTPRFQQAYPPSS